MAHRCMKRAHRQRIDGLGFVIKDKSYMDHAQAFKGSGHPGKVTEDRSAGTART